MEHGHGSRALVPLIPRRRPPPALLVEFEGESRGPLLPPPLYPQCAELAQRQGASAQEDAMAVRSFVADLPDEGFSSIEYSDESTDASDSILVHIWEWRQTVDVFQS